MCAGCALVRPRHELKAGCLRAGAAGREPEADVQQQPRGACPDSAQTAGAAGWQQALLGWTPPACLSMQRLHTGCALLPSTLLDPPLQVHPR